MLHVIASLYTERYTTYGVAPEEAECDTDAPLVPRAFVLQSGALLAVTFTMRTFEQHRATFAEEARYSNEFSLFFCD